MFKIDPNLMSKLGKLYEVCTPEEKNKFAEIVNYELKAIQAEVPAEKELKNTGELYTNSIPINKYKAPEITTTDTPVEVPITARPQKVSIAQPRKVYGKLSNHEIKLMPNLVDKFSPKYDSTTRVGLKDYSYAFSCTESYIAMSSCEAQCLYPGKSERFEISKGGEAIIVPPGETIMLMSSETFNFPTDVYGEVRLLDEYWKCGVMGLFRPLGPQFSGRVTFMIYNPNKRVSVAIEPKKGICEIEFYRPFSLCESEYIKLKNNR